MIYLDHAASTPVLPEALTLLSESYAQDFANPSAAHRLGKDLAKKLSGARESLKSMLGSATTDQLIFCSSATEANNLLISGLDLKAGEILLYSEADHPSLNGPVKCLPCERVALPLDHGTISPQKLACLINERVKLVLISQVNNHSGNIQDIEALSRLIKTQAPKAHIHVDASQSFTKIDIDLKKWNIDSLALSSHKMGGPRGVAALWLKKGVKLKATWEGGGQEFALRPSTEALPLILSFVEASRIALSRKEESAKHLSTLAAHLENLLKESIPGLLFPFENSLRSSSIITFVIPGISSDILLRLMEEKNIFVSSSSACSSKIKGHSSVFEALGIPSHFHKNVLRISLAPSSTKVEIESFVSTLGTILRDLSFLKK